jgi:hypothetical protein
MGHTIYNKKYILEKNSQFNKPKNKNDKLPEQSKRNFQLAFRIPAEHSVNKQRGM